MPLKNQAFSTLLALIAIAPTQSYSATLLVPSEHPTIQSAVTAASNGDLVLVSPGIYFERIELNGKGITLRSTNGPDVTVIDAQGMGGAVDLAASGGNEAVLEGFTVRRGASSFGAGVALIGGRAVVRNNRFLDNAQGSGGAGAAILCNGCIALVERNVLRGNTCDSQFVSGVISVLNGALIDIRSNLFVNNACRAINITAPSSARITVLGNTLAGNAAGIYFDARTGNNTGQIFRHNLVAFNNVGLDVMFGSSALTAQLADNVFFGNGIQVQGTASPIGTLGNRDVDPLLVDAGNGDYRLRIDSSLIDTPISGVTVPLSWGERDLAANSRLADGDDDGVARFDVGAFEVLDARVFRDGFEAVAE